MPELPEAQTIATQLDRCLRGAALGRVVLRLRKIVRGNGSPLGRVLAGRRVVRVTRRGKRVLVHLDPPGTLLFRLGMTGQIIVVSPDCPRDRHVHLRISLDGGRRELRFRDVRRFGGVWFTDGPATGAVDGLADLGPEPLTLTRRQFDRLMTRRRQIKALLLDQHAIAGLGNIYCDESLFAAGIHPLTWACDLDAAQRLALLRAIRRTLRGAIRAGGSTLRDYRTATGQEGQFQTQHRVYGREGHPCPVCGTPVRRIPAAGRSTHFCPLCQPPKNHKPPKTATEYNPRRRPPQANQPCEPARRCPGGTTRDQPSPSVLDPAPGTGRRNQSRAAPARGQGMAWPSPKPVTRLVPARRPPPSPPVAADLRVGRRPHNAHHRPLYRRSGRHLPHEPPPFEIS